MIWDICYSGKYRRLKLIFLNKCFLYVNTERAKNCLSQPTITGTALDTVNVLKGQTGPLCHAGQPQPGRARHTTPYTYRTVITAFVLWLFSIVLTREVRGIVVNSTDSGTRLPGLESWLSDFLSV